MFDQSSIDTKEQQQNQHKQLNKQNKRLSEHQHADQDTEKHSKKPKQEHLNQYTTTRISIADHQWMYLLINIEYENQAKSGNDADEDAVRLRRQIFVALRKSFGILGSAETVDILWLKGQRAILRTPFKSATMLAYSLSTTALSDIGRISVIKSSPFLLAIADDADIPDL